MQPPYPPAAFAADPGPAPAPSEFAGVSVIGAVKAVFDDPEWKHNVMFGLVFMLIPIVGPIALAGWMCEAHQRMARQYPNPVPRIDFSDFGDYIKRGLTVFLVQLVVGLPVGILAYAFMGGAAFATVAVISATDEPLLALAVGLVLGVVALLVMLSLSVFANAAFTRAELTESFGEALSLGPLMGYARATAWQVIYKNFLFMFVAIGLILVGMLICYVGLYPAAVVIQIAALHLRHQIYQYFCSTGGEAIPLKEAVMLQSEARAHQQAAWGGY